VTATMVGGSGSGLETSVVEQFGNRLRGALLLPGIPGYDEARSIWNAMIDRRPNLIARCLGVADVLASVNFAREHGLTLSIKGGGHNIAGLAVCDGGLMLDMSLMRGVWVDPIARTARAQAGCVLGDVDRETQLHGLAAVLGFVSTTGIAGLTLGGGIGYLTRQFGWTCDDVLSMDVVTADGRVVRASGSTADDLFWALRGGGGNFGVVTSFEYKLHPVGPEVVGGVIAWPAEEAPAVLEMYRRLTLQASPGLTCAALLRMAPAAPWLPKQVHGRPIVALVVCHAGPLPDAEREVAPIKTFGSPVGDIVQRRPYVSQQALLDATQPKGRRYYWKSEFLAELQPKLVAGWMEHAERIVSPHSAIVVFPIDGALNRLSTDYSAIGNRNAAWLLNITASWETAEQDTPNIEWARAAWRDMRRFSTGGTYVNFLTEEEGDERIHAAYGENYGRLVAVKSKWDPDNLFRMNKNIAPERAGQGSEGQMPPK
jgi:FAD/FMN-containing dehydrogenase